MPRSPFLPFALALLSGAMHGLGWAGFGYVPLAFFCFVPLLFALEITRGASWKRRFAVGLVHGTVAYGVGYHWLVEFLETFSGYSFLPSLIIGSLFFLYLGLLSALFALVYAPMRAGGAVPTLALVLGVVALERYFPTLFPSHLSITLHDLPLFLQVVDLGGPSLLTAMMLAVNGAIFEVIRSLVDRRRMPLREIAAAGAALGFVLAYGAYRTHEVEARVDAAKKVEVGLVQANMGILQKREDPREGHYRHIEQSVRLEREGPLDLLVWPESAYHYALHEDETNVSRSVRGPIKAPLLFGGLALRGEGDETRYFNTAYLADADGEIVGTYDKTYLLMFGEYLPFGERFPILYELSPNSGRFTKGTHTRPLLLGDMRITTLICYEDVLPEFTRDAVRAGDPNLLVNITNDAWFGDTQEPWIHLAMAKLRAVEHHRALVRATNSGVSAIISPTGEVIERSGLMERASLRASVPLLDDRTVFERLGSWPAVLALFAALYFVAKGRFRPVRER
jgi:apolipoprotein N-acyltransferase